MHAFEHQRVHLHYRVDGPDDAAPLVFTNSLGTDLRIWDEVLGLLDRPYRIVRHDQRGHGLSDAPPGPYQLDQLVDDLDALLAHLKVTDAVVCGLSVGGMVAQRLAALHPGRVRALVLCDTAHRIGPADVWDGRIETVNDHGMERIAPGVLERWFTPSYLEDRPEATALWRNMLLRTPAHGYTATCAAIRDADLTRSTATLRVPCLCVCGSQDQATPPELVRSLCGLVPGALYEPIENCGHLPCIEQPGRLARVLNRFLAVHARGSGGP